MKRNYLYYLLTILLLAVSCEKDEMACTTTVETQEVSSIAATTAQCGGVISSNGNPTIKEAGVEWCATSDFKSNVSCSPTAKAKLGKFACDITDLMDNTQYYVRAYARNSYGTIYGKVLSFKTLEIVLPAVLTDSVTNITISSATVGGEVTDESNGVVAERGVVYSTNPNPTVENNKVVCGRGKGAFTCNLTDLQDGVTYYVRAFAVNEKGIAYGEEKAFATVEIVVPTVTTASAVNISPTSATVGGEVTNDGNGEVAERGVVYSTNPNPTVENNKVVCGSGKGAFICNLTDLQDGVTYYVRAFAVNQKGTAYGEEKSFTTKAITAPIVTTSPATNILYTSAIVGGNVTDDGGATITERGVVYSTTPNPTTSNSKVVSGSGKGSFTCNLSNLQDGVTYYVRAYAVNQKGTAYGEEKSFTTKAIILPIVTTSPATNILYTSAIVGGNVTDDGGSHVTARGIVYSTTPNPTIANSRVANGSGSGKGAFSCNLSNLQAGITYYIRAYAVNQKGTSYGEEKSFTTNALTLPIVTTSPATNISYTSANVGGNITDDGGSNVTERGIVYSTTPNPTTANSKVASGSGKGSFTSTLTNLKEGTTYYVRAYAVNQKGTSYGEDISFTTLAHSSSDPTIKVVTVQEFMDAPVSDVVYYELTGTITDLVNTTFGNFDLTDETGTVYVWGLTKSFIAVGSTENDLSFASLGLNEGDKITIRGFRGSYDIKPEVHGAYFVRLVSKGDNGNGNTGNTPKTIVFDADVDQGDARIYTDGVLGTKFTVTKNGVTITVSQGLIRTVNDQTFYRIDGTNTLTVTSTAGNIKSIEFTCTGNSYYDNFTASTGSYNTSGTWTGSASNVVFTASKQVRVTEIEVVVE